MLNWFGWVGLEVFTIFQNSRSFYKVGSPQITTSAHRTRTHELTASEVLE